MNTIFNVYTKEGEVFLFSFYRFEIKEGAFVLYNDSDQPSKDGFLSLEHVAAVIPQRQHEPKDQAVSFRVYFRKHAQPAPVTADHFERDGDVFKFYWRTSYGQGPALEIENTYVAASEVVAITDPDGLRKFRY
jgi:hypothetical protein